MTEPVAEKGTVFSLLGEEIDSDEAFRAVVSDLRDSPPDGKTRPTAVFFVVEELVRAPVFSDYAREISDARDKKNDPLFAQIKTRFCDGRVCEAAVAEYGVPTFPSCLVFSEKGDPQVLVTGGVASKVINDAKAVYSDFVGRNAQFFDVVSRESGKGNEKGGDGEGSDGMGSGGKGNGGKGGDGKDAKDGNGEMGSRGDSEKNESNNGGKGDDEADALQFVESLVSSRPFVLFMKGNPDGPRCGFSRRMVPFIARGVAGIAAPVKCASVDVLEDEGVRAMCKVFSNWPTFPQFFAHGKLVGGIDVIEELAEDGSLDKVFNLRDDAAAGDDN